MSLPAAPLVATANNPQGVGHADAIVGGGLSVAGTVAVGTASTMGTPGTPVLITDGFNIEQFQMVGSKAFIRVVTTANFNAIKLVQISADPALGPNVSLVITPILSTVEANAIYTSFTTSVGGTTSVVQGQIEANPPGVITPGTRLPTNRLYSVVCL